jgi:hypothetical protein
MCVFVYANCTGIFGCICVEGRFVEGASIARSTYFHDRFMDGVECGNINTNHFRETVLLVVNHNVNIL